MNRHDEFADLLARHARILHYVSRAYARTEAEREDLAQEIALAVWKSFDGYDAARRFSTWMYRIALNVAISWWRQERRRPPLVTAEPLMPAAAAPAPDDDVEELYRLIGELEPADRSLVLLYLEGYSFQEIAEILAISPTNASTKLTRIKQAWRSA